MWRLGTIPYASATRLGRITILEGMRALAAPWILDISGLQLMFQKASLNMILEWLDIMVQEEVQDKLLMV